MHLIALLLLQCRLGASHEIASFITVGSSSSRCHQFQEACHTHYLHPRRRRETIHIHPSRIKYTNSCPPLELSSSTSNEVDTADEIQQTLRRYGFGSRIITLSNADLSQSPMLAEMYEGGNWKICLILGLKSPSSDEKPPLLEVLAMDDDGLLKDHKVIDIGESL